MNRDWDPEQPEWMDRPQPVNPGLERDLANLGALNRYFGGHALVRRFLERWLRASPSGQKPLRILDLCTGYGDIPRMIADWAVPRGIAVEIDAVDFHPATLDIAQRKSAAYPQIRFLHGDALAYSPPEPPARYDLVHCSLALHHFSEADAVRLLERCLHLSRRYVLVTDLERNRLSQFAVWLVTATLYRDPMTRHDARLSVRRAFSAGELDALAKKAGWHGFHRERFLPCRQALWMAHVSPLHPSP
ncbi:MAG TPA: methyltransferase domain-containing protein [Chthoniobacteraceae bacterium]|nr:methyltransferase domain-containing protein [Chthoniobacteraceae bacterium]